MAATRFIEILAVVAVLAGVASAHYALPSALPRQSLRLRGGADAAGSMGMPGMPGMGGMPGMPPGMNMDAMNSMFQNPAFQKMAESLMENPEFKKKMDDMMKNETMMKEYAKIGEQVMGMMGKDGNPLAGMGAAAGAADAAAGAGAGAVSAGAGGEAGAAGAPPAAGFEQMSAAAQNMMKDFLKPEKLQELATSEEMKQLQEDPKMQEIIKDVQTNGPMSVLKYYSDPNAMQIFSKISKLLGLPEGFSAASENFAKLNPGAGGMPGMPGMNPQMGMPPPIPGMDYNGNGEDEFKDDGPKFGGGAATDLE